jgi:hypothetical protein
LFNVRESVPKNVRLRVQQSELALLLLDHINQCQAFAVQFLGGGQSHSSFIDYANGPNPKAA